MRKATAIVPVNNEMNALKRYQIWKLLKTKSVSFFGKGETNLKEHEQMSSKGSIVFFIQTALEPSKSCFIVYSGSGCFRCQSSISSSSQKTKLTQSFDPRQWLGVAPKLHPPWSQLRAVPECYCYFLLNITGKLWFQEPQAAILVGSYRMSLKSGINSEISSKNEQRFCGTILSSWSIISNTVYLSQAGSDFPSPTWLSHL